MPEEVYISNSADDHGCQIASEEVQMEIRDILLAPAAIVLNGLSDVNIENPVDEQILRYNISTNKWENVIPAQSIMHVDRGDATSHDFELSDFIKDGDWHTLDLSGILPEGVYFVKFRWGLNATSTGSMFLRKKGNANTINAARQTSGAPGVANHGECTVVCNGDREIEYMFSNVNWTMIVLTVRGWIK